MSERLDRMRKVLKDNNKDVVIPFPKDEIITIAAAVLSFFASFYLIAFFMLKASYMALPYKVKMDASFVNVFYRTMESGVGNIVVCLALALLVAGVVVRARLKKLYEEEFGQMLRSDSGKFGNANWLNNEKALLDKTLVAAPTAAEPINIPLGMFKGKVYCVPYKFDHTVLPNSNVGIIGSSGMGKSYATVEPILLNRIAYREPFVLADTKGALYRKYALLCEKAGYKVKIFNATNFYHSDSWNFMRELSEAPEDRIYQNASLYASTIVSNTVDKNIYGKSDPYWVPNQIDLFRSILHLVAKEDAFKGRRNMSTVMDLVYSSVSELKAQFAQARASGGAARTAKSFVNMAKPEIQDNIRQGLANRLQLFRNPEIEAALSYDGINLEDVVKEQTALFIVTSDAYSEMDPIPTLFIQALYIKLTEISDSLKYHGKLKKPFWIILDELCNMATIPDLSKKISTSRSRGINFVLSVQSMSQMEERYPKLSDNILSNCATKFVFNTDDEMTQRHFSNIAGTYTQKVLSDMKDKPTILSKFYFSLHKKERVDERAKNLIEPADLNNMKPGRAVIFFTGKGETPFKVKAYTPNKHGLYKSIEYTELEDYNPEWLEEFYNDRPEFRSSPHVSYSPTEYELSDDGPVYYIKPDKDKEKKKKTEKDNSSVREKRGVDTILSAIPDDDSDDAEQEVRTRSQPGKEVLPNGETRERMARRDAEHKRFAAMIAGAGYVESDTYNDINMYHAGEDVENNAPEESEDPMDDIYEVQAMSSYGEYEESEDEPLSAYAQPESGNSNAPYMASRTDYTDALYENDYDDIM